MTIGGRERGFALIVVLWVVAALSLIAGAMLAASMTSAKIEKNAWAQVEVRNVADTAIQSAILSLFDPGNSAPLDGRARTSRTGPMVTTVSIQDEWGLVDVNHAGAGLLKTLLTTQGVDAEAADTLVSRMIRWRSPAGTTSTGSPDDGDYTSYRPRHGPFQSLDELNLVPGMSPEIYSQIAPALTIYAHAGDFDTRVAPRAVLMLLAGVSNSGADATLAARKGAYANPGHIFRILVTTDANGIRFSRRAVIHLTGDPARPYQVLDWQ